MRDMNILIVDDPTFDRQSLSRAFAHTGQDGITLTEADSAASAVEKLRDTSYDAVFLDVNLPGETGFSVLENIRNLRHGTWPFVFMMSSSRHPDDVGQAYASMATAFLCKPSDLSTMRDIASACLSLIRRSERTAA